MSTDQNQQPPAAAIDAAEAAFVGEGYPLSLDERVCVRCAVEAAWTVFLETRPAAKKEEA